MPVLSPVRYAGVFVALDRRFGDGWVPLLVDQMRDRPDYEGALVNGLRQHVRPGDRVVVVGGGWGVTAAIAAIQSGVDGAVTCFEGSAERATAVRLAASRNAVQDRVAVRHAIVGEAIHVYDTSVQAKIIQSKDLPECDVLQLDCEGAERSILSDLVARPRVVITETHGLYGSPTKEVAFVLSQMGYSIEDCGPAEPGSLFCVENDIRVLIAVKKDEVSLAQE